MTRIGFVGVGDMGSQMVPHLLAAGHTLTVFDVDPDRLEAMVERGAVAAADAADAARTAEVVISAVMSDDIPRAHFGPRGILAGMATGTVLVVLSTTTPEMIESLADAAPAGVGVVDAPLIGGVRYAREAALTLLPAGDDESVSRCEPILTALGDVVRVGPAGSGVAYKLITNTAVMGAEVGLREALDLADILGGSYEMTLTLLTKGPMAAFVARALDRDNPRPLRDSAADFDVLLAAAGPDRLPISEAGRRRLWAAVDSGASRAGGRDNGGQDTDWSPMFLDLTTHSTALSEFR